MVPTSKGVQKTGRRGRSQEGQANWCRGASVSPLSSSKLPLALQGTGGMHGGLGGPACMQHVAVKEKIHKNKNKRK